EAPDVEAREALVHFLLGDRIRLGHRLVEQRVVDQLPVGLLLRVRRAHRAARAALLHALARARAAKDGGGNSARSCHGAGGGSAWTCVRRACQGCRRTALVAFMSRSLTVALVEDGSGIMPSSSSSSLC